MYTVLETCNNNVSVIDSFETYSDAKICLFNQLTVIDAERRFVTKDKVLLYRITPGWIYGAYEQPIKTIEVRKLKPCAKQTYKDVLKELKILHSTQNSC